MEIKHQDRENFTLPLREIFGALLNSSLILEDRMKQNILDTLWCAGFLFGVYCIVAGFGCLIAAFC